MKSRRRSLPTELSSPSVDSRKSVLSISLLVFSNDQKMAIATLGSPGEAISTLLVSFLLCASDVEGDAQRPPGLLPSHPYFVCKIANTLIILQVVYLRTISLRGYWFEIVFVPHQIQYKLCTDTES